MTNNGLGGLEAGKHEKSRMFWTSPWPRCMCMLRGDKAASVSDHSETGAGQEGLRGHVWVVQLSVWQKSIYKR